MDPSHAGSANEQLSRKGPQKRPTVTTPAAKTGPIDPRISQEGPKTFDFGTMPT